MYILVTGATGLIGRSLCAELTGRGHEVCALVRSRHATNLPNGVSSVYFAPESNSEWRGAFAAADAVVNLAGEPVAGRRWNPEVKARLRSSRIETTGRVVDAIRDSGRSGISLVSASAVGYYGDRGDEILTESSGSRRTFLSSLCVEWESSAEAASAFGARVVTIRIGVVLDSQGGALKKMLYPLPVPISPWALGLGGPIGLGRHWMPWIHVSDLISLLCWALENENVRGPLNASAPQPSLGMDFARALGTLMKRPAVIPIPYFALRLMLGELATEVVRSQRAVPDAALREGFMFTFNTLEDALKDLLPEALRLK